MNVVADVVANDGLPLAWQTASPDQKESCHHRGTRVGAKLIFLSVALLPLCLGFSFWGDSPVPLFLPLMTFIIGSLWLIYTRIFGEEPMALNKKSKPGQRGLATPNIAALPPRKNSVGDFNPRGVVTGEFVEPPAVTDHTTRLFD